jgi:hypothetical protein
MLSFGLGGMTLVDVGGTVRVDEAAVLGFLLCNVGRLEFTSARTDGALACRVNLAGTTTEPLLGTALLFGRAVFVMELALSALRRAGFFRGFLTVVFEGCGLAVVVAVASMDVAMSIYLRLALSITEVSGRSF